MNDLAPKSPFTGKHHIGAAVLLLVLIGITYASSYRVPFLFDDIHAIVENPNIRHWQSFSDALTAPDQSSFAGRPLVNLSFALQTQADGTLDPTSLHIVNTIIHFINAFVLFELIYLVLLVCDLTRLKYSALAMASIWAIHPINTEAVVYLTQRTELLVSLFYLLTCYASLHYLRTQRWYWLVLALITSALGMCCKENMVSVPVMVLLINFVLFGNTFKKTWPLHVGLAATWLILLWLNISGPRDASAGLHVGITSWEYLLTQSTVIPLYLWQVLTGHHLSIVHDWPLSTSITQTLPTGLLPVVLLLLTIWGVCKRKAWSLAGVGFFFILAPTSSFIPIATELVAERRMYLPSAMMLCVLVLCVRWLYRLQCHARIACFSACFIVIFLCVRFSHSRIADYHQPRTLWASAVKLYPHDARALNGLGHAFIDAGDYKQALPILLRATEADSRFAESFDNLGLCYLHEGDLEKAKQSFEKAININDTLAKPYNNLGITLGRAGDLQGAMYAFTQALARQQHLPAAHLNLGITLNKLNDFDQAMLHLKTALPMLDRDNQCMCLMQMAYASLGLNHPGDAMGYLEKVLQIKPDHAQAGALLNKLKNMK